MAQEILNPLPEQLPDFAETLAGIYKRYVYVIDKDQGPSDELLDSYHSYKRETDRYPLLTLTEELVLGKTIQDGQAAKAFVEQLSDVQKDRPEYQTYHEQITRAGTAREVLTVCNLRLVPGIAGKYPNRGLPFMDLVQEGNIGLMTAVEKYDYRKGYRFSTFAVWEIKYYITRAIADQAGTIRVPAREQIFFHQAQGLRGRLEQPLRGKPDGWQLVAAYQIIQGPAKGNNGQSLGQLDHASLVEKLTSWRPSKTQQERLALMVRRLEEDEAILKPPLSLNTPAYPDGEEDLLLGGTIEDPRGSLAYREALSGIDLNNIMATAGLSERECYIFILRLNRITLEEIGLKVGLSRERISQIQKKAEEKLKNPEILAQIRDMLSG